MVVDSGHQVINFLKRVSVSVSFLAANALSSSNRIEVNQPCTDRRPERSTEEVLNVVVSALSTDGVAVILDQRVKDSIDVRRADLTKLHLRDEFLNDVVIALVALNGDIAELSSGLAAHTGSQVGFEVGLHSISGLTLSLTEIDLRQFQISECLNVTGNVAILVVPDLPELLVRIDTPLNAILYDPLADLQNPPLTVDPDMSGLHFQLLRYLSQDNPDSGTEWV